MHEFYSSHIPHFTATLSCKNFWIFHRQFTTKSRRSVFIISLASFFLSILIAFTTPGNYFKCKSKEEKKNNRYDKGSQISRFLLRKVIFSSNFPNFVETIRRKFHFLFALHQPFELISNQADEILTSYKDQVSRYQIHSKKCVAWIFEHVFCNLFSCISIGRFSATRELFQITIIKKNTLQN